MIRALRLFLAALVLAVPAFAHPDDDHSGHPADCKHTLLSQETSKHVRILSSGRDEAVLPEYTEAIEFLHRKGGLLDQLGIANPYHLYDFAPSGQLQALSILGRHAVRHWHDGSQLAQGLRSRGSVLEFVTPGLFMAPQCPVCRSFYADTTHPTEQLSIIFHVAGHNDFAANSIFCTQRPCDPISESLELDRYMERLYREVDHDEVSRWFQWLLSLASAQDLARGTFEAPEAFDPAISATADGQRIVHAGTGTPYPTRRHPRHASPSVLQAFVANLPSTLAPWKAEVARRFERIYRVYGFYTSNKITNEGWATFLMKLLPPHTRWSTTAHIIDYAQLLAGVAVPSLSNPYWLGLQAWERLYKKFSARPDIRPLALLERDRRFIAWAHETVISTMDDYEFLRFALDEQWVRDHKLHLSRPAGRNEWDESIPPPTKPNQEQKLVLTTEPRRVVDAIARKVADKRLFYPRILVESLSGLGHAAVDLRHEVVENIPLERKSAIQTMFVMASMKQAPVSLVTVAASSWTAPKTPKSRWGWWPWMPRPDPLRMLDVRYEVSPDGKVQVFVRGATEDGQIVESRHSELRAQLQEAVDVYREELQYAGNDGLSDSDQERLGQFVTQAVNHATAPGMHLLSHAPTAGAALLEYADMVKRGLMRAVHLAATGKLKPRRTRTGVRLKVLPTMPEFAFDRRIMEKLREQLPPAPTDPVFRIGAPGFLAAPQASREGNADDNSDIGSGDRGTGDRYWGDRREKQKGQGDDEDEDGDPEDGDPDIGQDSGDPMDPSEVEIPHDLFASLLLQEFRLPFLESKVDGESDQTDSVRDSFLHRPHGNVNWPRSLANAPFYAIEARRRKGLPWRGIPQHQLLREGLKYLPKSDYVVSDRSEVPQPISKAVVVFVIDTTGSMHGLPHLKAKRWVGYVDWLIRAHYNDVDVRFVIYSDAAFEVSRTEVWNKFIGGGNTDSNGLIKGKEIILEKKYDQHDKYVFAIGDGGSYDSARTHELQEELYRLCRYSGWVRTTVIDNHVPEFIEPMRERARQMERFGYAELDASELSLLRSVGEFFKSPLAAAP